jgi:hypothetical protein
MTRLYFGSLCLFASPHLQKLLENIQHYISGIYIEFATFIDVHLIVRHGGEKLGG